MSSTPAPVAILDRRVDQTLTTRRLQVFGRERVTWPSPTGHTLALQVADHGRAVGAEVGSQVIDFGAIEAHPGQLRHCFDRQSLETLERSGRPSGHPITPPTGDNPFKSCCVVLVGILDEEPESSGTLGILTRTLRPVASVPDFRFSRLRLLLRGV